MGRTMELTFEDMMNAEAQQKADQADLEKHAAKQLLAELMMLKQKAYGKGTLVSSVLIVQIKQVLRGLMTKYNEAGLLLGENITLRLSDKTKHASIGFVYSPGLQLLMTQIIGEIVAEQKAAAEVKPEEVQVGFSQVAPL